MLVSNGPSFLRKAVCRSGLLLVGGSGLLWPSNVHVEVRQPLGPGNYLQKGTTGVTFGHVRNTARARMPGNTVKETDHLMRRMFWKYEVLLVHLLQFPLEPHRQHQPRVLRGYVNCRLFETTDIRDAIVLVVQQSRGID